MFGEEPEISDSNSGVEFPGWGRAERITDLPASSASSCGVGELSKEKLGPWRSTAICGNDITSSVLYVSALCAAQAGILAPLVLLGVGLVLFLYRKIYAEVGSALPLNGGTYTVLLNTTNKRLAAGAACLTILSYIATAVISANEAMHYAHNLLGHLDVHSATVALLALFAVLTVLGISESAAVALVIFILHMITLSVLAVAGIYYVIQDPSLFQLNWQMPSQQGLLRALFFGFAAAMLGVSGFESSANFIEEQKPGVFPKTLRNMWIAVIIFNPLISLLSLGLLPLQEIQTVPPDLLARMGEISLGPLFRQIVSFDAVLVLSGAVLTSYVGITGLVRRMSLDRCLPQFLLKENRWRRTNHWIILGFFVLCASIHWVTEGDITKLAGVYALSFLSVMGLYAIGNMLLKQVRAGLPRNVRAGWPMVVIAFLAVAIGFVGNVFLEPLNVVVFGGYFLLAWCAIAVMFLRIQILGFILMASQSAVERLKGANEQINNWVKNKINQINARAVVFFTKGGDLKTLNQAALYVLENEETNNMKIVHVYEDENEMPEYLPEQIEVIDELYPQLRIDFIAVKGSFGADIISQLSERLRVPKNMMFIGAPGNKFPHRIETLGGVRVVLA